MTPDAAQDFIPRWLDMDAACYYASISKNALMEFIKRQDIYGTKKGGKWRIERGRV